MEIQTLSHAGALSPGSQLWVLPASLGTSQWLTSVDWYLNFQCAKANYHEPKSLAPELMKMAENIGFKIFYTPPSQDGHLMVLSKKLLPNEQTVFIPSESPENWLAESYKVWDQLNKPNLRLFLPKGLTVERVQSLFSETVTAATITLALDRGDH